MAGQTPGSRPSRSSEDRSCFDKFIDAQNLSETYEAFHELCGADEDFTSETPFHEQLKNKVQFSSWKAGELLKEIDKVANRKVYNKGKACPDTKVLIIGAGPCGLRASIELALLGAKVIVIEKRSSFTRNNVLHLWPYLVTDLTSLGVKKLYGKFGTGDINHISIIKLQVNLLKIALLVGVKVHYNVEFVSLDEKPKKEGWRANLKPKEHEVSKYEFSVIIAADGRQNTLPGFTWKEKARSLAIGITTNYVNRQSQEDANTKEIPGKSYIYHQEFFQDLKKSKNIDLENIVYYKDETHYFVMTAKKQSLIDKGVIKKDNGDVERLLASDNINQKNLQQYATEAALYATEGKLPTKEFALNHKDKPDIAMFDFTSSKQATKAVIPIEADGKTLLMAVVGDSLKEPFWPEGTGCAHGFLGVFDTVWMIRSIATGDRTLAEALRTREAIFTLLPNTKQEDLQKNFNKYTIDPRTRYTSQVALSKDLYKEEPKRQDFQRTSSFDNEQPRNRTVSEIVTQREQQVPSGSRRRLKSTAFSLKKKTEDGEETVKWLKDKKKEGKEKKEQKSVKKKEKKQKEDEEKKGKDAKPKDKVKEKVQKDKTKEKKEKNEKKEKKEKSKKQKKEEKSKKQEGCKKKKADQYQHIKNEDSDLSWQEKSRSLNRREFSFNESLSMFQNNDGSNAQSPTRNSTEVEQEEPSTQKRKRRWNPLKWLRRTKKRKDEVDGKKKKEQKSKKKKSKKEKKTKEKNIKDETTVETKDDKIKDKKESSETEDDVDRNSGKDERDGGQNQGYERMSSSDEKISKKIKSERGHSLLKRITSGKGKHSNYNSLKMETEPERPIGS